ncbi:MAG: hypothetical protein NTU94_04095 [Planctomycetota bacterium]|nr:hypothetical protein [Planctomycetota bacterium]
MPRKGERRVRRPGALGPRGERGGAAPARGAEAESPPRVRVKVLNLYTPNLSDWGSTRRLVRLMKEDPGIAVEEWGGLKACCLLGLSARPETCLTPCGGVL